MVAPAVQRPSDLENFRTALQVAGALDGGGDHDASVDCGGGGRVRPKSWRAGAEVATEPPATPDPFLANRPGRNRTCNPRFWRPVLYQLSYGPRWSDSRTV